jgi:hypothetical protein
MLELHRFFFPDSAKATQGDIEADANSAVLKTKG